MMPCTPKASPHEADRRAGQLVFRGYACFANRSRGYPMPVRKHLLAEFSDLTKLEQHLRQADTLRIGHQPWNLEEFRIMEIHPNNPFARMQEWLFDATMHRMGHLVHDRRIRFSGREPAECRFSLGQLVEFVFDGCLRLGCVNALPLSPQELAEGRSHGLIIALGMEMGDVYADQSDDTYIVDFLDLDDCGPYSECQLQPARQVMENAP